MAIMQLQNLESGTLRTLCYYKWVWSAVWIPLPYLEPISAIKSAAPSLGQATFRMRYGSGFWEDGASMINGDFMSSFTFVYIQIRGFIGQFEKILWTGVIQTEEFKLLGRSGLTYTADQTIKGFSLDWLMDSRLEGAYAEPVISQTPVWINHLPVFNKKHEIGGTIIGNKSDWNATLGCYVFGHNGGVWSNYDIIQYLLLNYQFNNGPFFNFWANADILTALTNQKEVWDFSNLTLRAALNKLIDRNRGLTWRYVIDYYGIVTIIPYSLLDIPITIGGVTIPANDCQISVNLWDNQKTQIEIEQDTSQQYDQIIVYGEKMKTCFTVDFATNTLFEGWSLAEEDAYLDAAKNIDGYDELDDDEKARLNDNYRATDKFDKVFAAFRLPYSFDWTIEGHSCVPLLDGAGVEIPGGADYLVAPYYNADKRIRHELPFLVGYDYSSLYPVNNNPANSEPEYRKMFVVALDNDGRYQFAEDMHVTDQDGEAQQFGASVRPMARELGFICHFTPAYMAANGYFAGAEPAEHNLDGEVTDIGIDYENLMATIFVETDQVVKMIYNLNNYENKRIKSIYCPDAELWYIAWGTIVDIDADGVPVFYEGEPFIRDDRVRIRNVLAAAVAWYGRQRNRLNITIREIDAGIELGTLINNLGVTGQGAAGSAVTSISYNFCKPVATIVRTDFAELNIENLLTGK